MGKYQTKMIIKQAFGMTEKDFIFMPVLTCALYIYTYIYACVCVCMYEIDFENYSYFPQIVFYSLQQCVLLESLAVVVIFTIIDKHASSLSY